MVIEADRRLDSDALLVAQAASGDESAYKALYERHHQHLLAVLRASVPAALAEEAAQEAWARAYERIDTLDKPQAFFSWLTTIARNYARDHHRSTTPQSLSLAGEHDWIPEPSPGPDTVVEQDEDRRLAARALQRLPDKQRAALVLRNLEGRSYLSIAGRLGISVSATETLLHRARSNFQREFTSLQSGSDAPALACYKMRASIRALSTGALSDLRRMRVIAHLEGCDPCRSMHEDMRRTRRIAGFLPLFLPVAWLRDKLLHVGKAIADGASKVGATTSAGASSLGATPLVIISGGLAVATISGAVFLSATVLDLPALFSSSDNDELTTSQSQSPSRDAPTGIQQRPVRSGAVTPAGNVSEVNDLDIHDARPQGVGAGQGDTPPPSPNEVPAASTDPPVNQGAPAAGCQVEPCGPPSSCEPNCNPPGPPPDPCASNPNAEGCSGGDPCTTNPNAEGCGGGDPCASNPNAEGCGGGDPCVLNPSAPGCADGGGDDGRGGGGGNGGGGNGGGGDCGKPGSGGGHGYGHCKRNGQEQQNGGGGNGQENRDNGNGQKEGHST